MNRTLITAAAVVLIAGGLLTIVTGAVLYRESQHAGKGGSSGPIYEYDHGNWQDVPVLEDFTLTERSGDLFRSQEMEGKVWVVTFFFASCPGYCRQQNLRVEEIAREYGPRDVTFVSITVDPENDNPKVLRKYAHEFHADEDHWKFLTGDLLHIRRIGAEIFQVPTDQQTHSERLIVIGRWGKLRGTYHWREFDDIAAMKKKLDELLAETEPPAPEPPPERPKIDEETGLPVKNKNC